MVSMKASWMRMQCCVIFIKLLEMSWRVISQVLFLKMNAVPHKESNVTQTLAFLVNCSGTLCWSLNRRTHLATSP